MQLRQFLRFYIVLCTISLVAQAPIVLFGWEDTTATPYRFWLTLAVLAFAPWAAALLSRIPDEPEPPLPAKRPSPFALTAFAAVAAAISLGGHVVAVAAGWGAVDWSLHTLEIGLGSPEAYGLSAFPPLWTLFAARLGLSLGVAAGIAFLCLPMLAAWRRRGEPALERLGPWGCPLSCGFLAALPWTPLAYESALSPLEGLSAAPRLLAMASVAGAIVAILLRRTGSPLLAASAIGFIVIFADEGWGPLFPDAPPAVAGPAGWIHIGLWSLTAAGLQYGRIPQLVRRTIPERPQTKADILKARRQSAAPPLAKQVAPEPTPPAPQIAPPVAPPVKTVKPRAKAAPSSKAKANPKTKAKAKAKASPAKRNSAAVPKKKTSARKPKSR